MTIRVVQTNWPEQGADPFRRRWTPARAGGVNPTNGLALS
jgi:hypothetical protein